MKIFRFMSKKEFEKYENGETLKNNTIHKGKTNSIGFCFLDAEEYTPEKALHFLSGIVAFDICAVFETEKKLNKTYGVYAKPIKSTGNPFEDLLNIFAGYMDNFTANEYCTTKYSNKDFKLLKYSENIWEQWEPKEEQSKIKWREGVLNEKEA